MRKKYVMRRFAAYFALAIGLGMLMTASGCNTARKIPLADPVGRLALAERLAHADKRFDQKQYLMAAALYRQILNNYPEGKSKQRIYLQLGRCYYNEQVQSLSDAHAIYTEYLQKYPDGYYVEEVKHSLERLEMIVANRKEDLQRHYEQLAGNVEKLQSALNERPYDSDLYLKMGNALWGLERYDEAVEYYMKATEINAAVKEYNFLKERMMLNDEGDPIPITPDKKREMEREADPLVVFDTHEYKSRTIHSEQAAREVYYNIFGKVRNQSNSKVRNVVIEVIFYNPAREILDSKTTTVGNIPAGGVRAWGVRASSYDNIYNISSYDVQAYER